MAEVEVRVPSNLNLSEEQRKKLEAAFTNTLVDHVKEKVVVVAKVKNEVVSEIGRV
jgi:hypothetical protein